MSLSTPPVPEPANGSTDFAPSIPRPARKCPLNEHSGASVLDEQPGLIGQCPYCGRVNFVPLAPFNVYYTRAGVKRTARVGQVVRGYLPGSTSRTCPACARAAFTRYWDETHREAGHHASH